MLSNELGASSPHPFERFSSHATWFTSPFSLISIMIIPCATLCDKSWHFILVIICHQTWAQVHSEWYLIWLNHFLPNRSPCSLRQICLPHHSHFSQPITHHAATVWISFDTVTAPDMDSMSSSVCGLDKRLLLHADLVSEAPFLSPGGIL